jgi:hypothetical protein
MENFLPQSWTTVSHALAPAPPPVSPPPSVTGKRTRESTYEGQGVALTMKEVVQQLTEFISTIEAQPQLYVDINSPRLRSLWSSSLNPQQVPRKRTTRMVRKTYEEYMLTPWGQSLSHPGMYLLLLFYYYLIILFIILYLYNII